MSNVILKAEGISKQYRLGSIGTGTLSHDLNRWWASVRGKEDPYLKIGESNDRSTKGTSDYVWALEDINFEVKKGEVLGIIGKNGAGKSTLLKILSRVTAPTTGVIKTKGRIASLLEVGTGFHAEMTGRENIYLNGAILGMTKKEIQSKIAEIIEFSGCERYIDTPVKRYSSGMTVRLAFAVAAFLEPEILVIDEVLAVGDAEFQKKAIGKMQDISRGEGRTVIFVSHNMAAVKSLCTRGIVMENGKVVFKGGIEESVENYIQASSETVFKTETKDYSNGEIEVVECIFIRDNGKIIRHGEQIGLGENINLKLTLDVKKSYQDLSISFDILDNTDSLMSHITNDDDGIYFGTNDDGRTFNISIKFKSILFNPKAYKINLWIGYAQIQPLYTMKNVLSFEILQNHITKRTKELPLHAKVYTITEWDVN